MKERVKIKCQRCLLKMEFIANPRLKHLCKPKVEVVVQIQGLKIQIKGAQKSEPPGSCPNHQVEIYFCGQNALNLQVHLWTSGCCTYCPPKLHLSVELSAITPRLTIYPPWLNFPAFLWHFVPKKHAWWPRIIQLQIRVFG